MTITIEKNDNSRTVIQKAEFMPKDALLQIIEELVYSTETEVSK